MDLISQLIGPGREAVRAQSGAPSGGGFPETQGAIDHGS
jgi:hypothetical protein